MVTPTWISKELFETALRRYFGNNNIKILGYTSSSAVPAGDNYTSLLFRTCVTYQTNQHGNRGTISLIVKCTLEDKEQMQQFVKETQLFEREIEMYTKILPAIYDLLGECSTFSANFIYYTNKPSTVIMFEDLTTLGFKMHNRQEGLDLDHCLLIVEKMATFHAASIVLHEKDPCLVKNYENTLFANNEVVSAWAVKGFESLIKASEKWTGLEKYSNKMRFLEGKIIENAEKASQRTLGGFNVLNHGDAWINNFMFSYTDEGTLRDCRFVDYQLVVYASPAIDLHYFWATSPKMEVRRKYLDTVLDRYYSKLILTLSKLNYSLERVPTKKQFRKDWNSRAFYGLVASIMILPIVKASSRKDASFDDLLNGEEEDGFRHHVYNNEAYRKHMEFLLPFYDDLGVLDCY